MTPDEFRRAMQADPFRPFVIPLRGGESVAVWERDQVALPAGRDDVVEGEAPFVVIVRHDKNVVSMVNLSDGIRHYFDLSKLR